MKNRDGKTERRKDALSKAKIIETAIAILDAEGENALTFRELGARLSTGSGAIYWHIENKGALLAAAADEVIAGVMTKVSDGAEPREAIRSIALGLFDAVEAHPWVGAELSRAPVGAAMLRIFEGIGGQLLGLGLPEASLFDSWSALVIFIFGIAVQNAANARHLQRSPDQSHFRSAFLNNVATGWEGLDPDGYPFMHKVAEQFRQHDDREQFLAGIDIILAGIETGRIRQ
ncbi:TetR/AcrR family transcriptional regulator [Consotaella aegiceratis]|uniref:TetR/AcrR family transcriptional regulator n=1 Tax=Consotaella aegiceratis TaxID=3097961 RepID=UPI002F41E19F